MDEEIKATARALVEHCYLRVLLKLQKDGRSPGQLDQDQRDVVLGAWQDDVAKDLPYAETLMVRAQELALNATREALHRDAEGVDHALVDEAIDYALNDHDR
jgi:hypothetical protein